ncbi:hypothetical protein VHEMI00412 [[Torrubiella] hemipterigena]|uniref:Uncharacterized protein n=1 Tax=[Torrubiella] hemipterigena TaxID=1531966 RepID=A0A0A1T2B2_9HYPO|nr:hypothetical protein VHEMI00412 [[Torrubiella] hemipterigena]
MLCKAIVTLFLPLLVLGQDLHKPFPTTLGPNDPFEEPIPTTHEVLQCVQPHKPLFGEFGAVTSNHLLKEHPADQQYALNACKQELLHHKSGTTPQSVTLQESS